MDELTQSPAPDDGLIDPIGIAVLDRYLAGRATVAECERVDRWRRDARHADLFEGLRTMRAYDDRVPALSTAELEQIVGRLEARRLEGQSAAAGPAFNVDALRSQRSDEAIGRVVVHENGGRQGRTGVGTRVVPSGTRVLRRWSGYVSAALIVLVAWFATTRSNSTHTPLPQRVYASGVGQRLDLTLTDGTRITLAPRTTLRLIDTGVGAHQAILDGEAYFNVAHRASAPFSVVTGRTTTNVLGTTFLVRHYATDSHVRVVVTAGKVSVSGQSNRQPSVLLTSGAMGDITDSSAVTSVPDDLAQYTGWLDEKLVFHNTPAPEVLAALTRWYGYEFRLTDSTLLERHLTAGVSTRSSKEALSTLKLLLHVDLKFDGSIVTLMPMREQRTLERPSDPIMTHRDSEVGR